MMMGCYDIPSSGKRQVVKALHVMDAHPDDAIVLLESVNDSIIREMRLAQSQLVLIYRFKAAGFVRRRQYNQAERWLDRVLYVNPFSDGWKQSCRLYKSLAQLEVVEKLGADSLADSLRTALVSQMVDVPKPNVGDSACSELEQKIINHPFYPILTVLIFLGLLVVIWYDDKEKKINSLCDSLESNEQQANQLRQQLDRMQTRSREQLGLGQTIYENVCQGGTMKNISVADEQCFVDYYAFSEPKRYMQLMAPYKQLSLRHTTYLILREIGYGDSEIQQILFVQPSTIRNYRLRMSRNRK